MDLGIHEGGSNDESETENNGEMVCRNRSNTYVARILCVATCNRLS